MKEISVHYRKDIPNRDLGKFFPISINELRKAGFVVNDWYPNTLYLDNENYKKFMEAKYKQQQMFPEEITDKNTGFLSKSQEYNDYYYPKKDNSNTDNLNIINIKKHR